MPTGDVTDQLQRLTSALSGRYAVERELGSGGMAIVYLAQDLKYGRHVAVKVLRPELSALLGTVRFLQEITVTARLTHPHILPLLDSGESDGFVYYVMPFAEGESLRGRLDREKQLPIDESISIASEVADALRYAHGHAVIHRDIKPDNILLESGHAVLADFGIARAIDVAGGAHLTATGIAMGTPAYMSPEQAAGSSDLDARADVYSLGCVLYEMLAGQPPFTGPTADSVVRQHMTSEAPSIAILRPAVPATVAEAVSRALAKLPADRFKSVVGFRDALTVPARRLPTAAIGRTSRRAVGLSILGIAGALGIGAAFFFDRRSRQSELRTHAYPRSAVAVLPFQNLSAEGDDAYVARGLHDELVTQLSKVRSLTVISRTSVMGYAGTNPPLRQVARELGVGSVVEGSVQVLGRRLRVNVRLVDATSDAHVWGEGYDRTLNDAFAIESEVAQRIVEAIGAALTSVERHEVTDAPTQNAESYRLYLQGREYATRPGYVRVNFVSAQELFDRAVALDSSFALAHAALSEIHGLMYWWRYDPTPQRAALQRGQAEMALRLEPDLPQAHIAMGLAHYWGRRDYQRALEELATALKRLPNDAQLWVRIGVVHRRLGNWKEVISAFETAKRLNPRSANLFYDLGGDTYRLTRQYQKAVRAFDQALTLAPDLYDAAVYKGLTYATWQGQLDTLRAVLSRLPSSAELSELGTKDAQHAQLVFWERRADSLLHVVASAKATVFEAQRFFLPGSLYAAWAHALRGDRPAAQAAFESARLILDSVVTELPGDWRVHSARGLALAGLGRRNDALREAQWLRESPIYSGDFLDGPKLAEDRAHILAQVGATQLALDEIERLLKSPSSVSAHSLNLDPLWDPIRNHPRFQKLAGRRVAE